jgi:hypothetical protein
MDLIQPSPAFRFAAQLFLNARRNHDLLKQDR